MILIAFAQRARFYDAGYVRPAIFMTFSGKSLNKIEVFALPGYHAA